MPDHELAPPAQFGLGCLIAGLLELGYTVADIHDMVDLAIATYRTMGLPDVPGT